MDSLHQEFFTGPSVERVRKEQGPLGSFRGKKHIALDLPRIAVDDGREVAIVNINPYYEANVKAESLLEKLQGGFEPTHSFSEATMLANLLEQRVGPNASKAAQKEAIIGMLIPLMNRFNDEKFLDKYVKFALSGGAMGNEHFDETEIVAPLSEQLTCPGYVKSLNKHLEIVNNKGNQNNSDYTYTTIAQVAYNSFIQIVSIMTRPGEPVEESFKRFENVIDMVTSLPQSIEKEVAEKINRLMPGPRFETLCKVHQERENILKSFQNAVWSRTSLDRGVAAQIEPPTLEQMNLMEDLIDTVLVTKSPHKTKVLEAQLKDSNTNVYKYVYSKFTEQALNNI